MRHGYQTREDWKVAYDHYYDLIRKINERSHSLQNVDRPFEEWFHDYKKQSYEMQKLYHENDDFIENDILYFVNSPQRWEPSIADSLLSYLFRYGMHMEDTVTVYTTIQSLQEYYEKRNDEIAIMKCYFIRSICLFFLDMYHFTDEILTYCEKAQDIYERRYEELNQEEKSMGLTLYDIIGVMYTDTMQVDEHFTVYFTDVIYPKLKHGIAMVERFIEEADMSLDVNKVLPFLRDSMIEGFIFMMLLIPKGELADEIENDLYEYAKEYRKKYENEPNSVQYIKSNIIFHMSLWMQETEEDEIVINLIQEEFDNLTIHRVASKETFDMNILDVLVNGITAIKTITKNKPESQYILKDLLHRLIEYISYLPFGKYLDHVADNVIFHDVCPLLRYLDDEEELLRAVLYLTVFRQIQTAIHSLMVGKTAYLLTSHMIKERPDLLIGQLSCETVEEVKEKEDEFLKYIFIASLVHDVGKVCCTNVINMQYRRLSNIEFRTIQFHPVSSGQILKQIPQLSCYHDIAVGHHKSYDGTYGYPKEFDSCASPQRIFIDLISICDSLDAATDTYGRNYAKAKSFDTVFQELVKDKGKRYSDQIIDMIIENPTIQDELRNLLETGREDVFRETFNMLQTEYKHIEGEPNANNISNECESKTMG